MGRIATLRHRVEARGGHITVKDLEGEDMTRLEANGYEPEWWKGEGYYSVKFSDGGQDFTNNGPVWLEDEDDLAALYESAWTTATEAHLPYVEYIGQGFGTILHKYLKKYL